MPLPKREHTQLANAKRNRKAQSTTPKRKQPVRRHAGKPKETKQARLIALLRRPQGATMEDLIAATGWRRHTVRGAISGALRKRLGLTVTTAQSEKGSRIYQIPA